MGMFNYPKNLILGMRKYPLDGLQGDINEVFGKCSFLFKFKEGNPPDVD